MSNCITSPQFITLFLKKSIPLYSSSSIFIKTPHLYTSPLNTRKPNNHPVLILPPLASMSTFTTPPEFPSRRVPEVDPATPPEIPHIPTDPDKFIITPEPEIKPPIPPPDPVPNPPGPDLPNPPIPSPPGPDIVPPPEAPPPRLPPDVVPPTPPEILPPPSTPPPDIIPPTGPMVV